MTIARVLGSVTSSIHHPALNGAKLLLVLPFGTSRAGLAVDGVGAGTGDTVLIVEEGAVAANYLGRTDPPVKSVVVGIVDVGLSVAEA